MFDSLLHLRSCGLAFRRQTISLVDITRSAKRSWTWSLTGRLRHLAYLVCSLGAVHFALLGTIHRVHPRTDVSSYGLPACLPGTSCQSLNLHSCVYHRASESGSASWPTTAAGQKILPAFGITCNLTLQMCLWNFPASNTVVAYIQAPGCRASASTMSFGQTPWMLLSTSDEPLSSMGGL